MGFRVQSLGIWSLGFIGFRVKGLGSEPQKVGTWIEDDSCWDSLGMRMNFLAST